MPRNLTEHLTVPVRYVSMAARGRERLRDLACQCSDCQAEYATPQPGPASTRRSASPAPRVEAALRPECGTRQGYQLHGRAGEQTCRACRDAWNEYQREMATRRGENRGQLVLDPCGTYGALKRHRKAHEPPDDACRKIEREVYRKRYARTKSRAANPLPEQVCEFCEGRFRPKQRGMRFCSAVCRVWAYEARRNSVLALRLATPEEREQILAGLVKLRWHYEEQRARYGPAHQDERARRLARYSPADPCARCGRPLGDDVSLIELDHDDADPTKYLGLSCRHCNRSAGGRASAATRWVA